MQDNTTPEEKLLNIIKKGTTKKDEAPNEEPSLKKSIQSKKGVIVLPKKNKSGKLGLFSVLNKLLILIVIASGIYMWLEFAQPKGVLNKIPAKMEENAKTEINSEVPQKILPLSNYLDVLNKRQLFKLYEQPKPKAQEPSKPKITIQQVLAGYTFVGIIFGDNPQAIVEEKKSGQSYYLTAGQTMGEIKIDKIEKGKITVSYEDQTTDINI